MPPGMMMMGALAFAQDFLLLLVLCLQPLASAVCSVKSAGEGAHKEGVHSDHAKACGSGCMVAVVKGDGGVTRCLSGWLTRRFHVPPPALLVSHAVMACLCTLMHTPPTHPHDAHRQAGRQMKRKLPGSGGSGAGRKRGGASSSGAPFMTVSAY
jgi:hypothetical protein